VSRLPDDRFRVFVSHKHEDHALAVAVQQALEGLSSRIECFVSGVSIAAGTDWSRDIRTHLAQSHLLVLLFTRPTAAWDWCLFETGLYTREDRDDVSAVVCVYDPKEAPPGPLATLQGVPALHDAIERFLGDVCRETWRVSDDWHLGALMPRVRQTQLARAAAHIVAAFPRADAAVSYYPCHRVVLDLRGVDDWERGIPEDATVVVGPDATTAFTLTLFNHAGECVGLTWGDLLDAVDGRGTAWRTQLDRRFVCALAEELFTPITATFRAWNQGRRRQRLLKPVLYRINRESRSGSARAGTNGERGRPTEVTVVFDPIAAPARENGPVLELVRIHARLQHDVFDEFTGTVHARAREGIPVLADIGEALSLVDDEATTCGAFDESELRRVHGPDYDERGIDVLGRRWASARQSLDAAIADADLDAVESELTVLGDLNGTLARLSAERYLRQLEALTHQV